MACPTLNNFLQAEQCEENLSGTSTNVYAFLVKDFAAALSVSSTSANTYELDSTQLESGKYLVKLECKEEQQQIQGSSLGNNKGFKLQFDFALDAVNPQTSMISRAMNNNKIGLIVKDGDGNLQLMYHPEHRVKFDSDGIKTDTGKAYGDDRLTTFSATLQPVEYSNLYLTLKQPATGGGTVTLDSLCNLPEE